MRSCGNKAKTILCARTPDNRTPNKKNKKQCCIWCVSTASQKLRGENKKEKKKEVLRKSKKRKPDATAPDESEQINLESHGAYGAAVMQCRAFCTFELLNFFLHRTVLAPDRTFEHNQIKRKIELTEVGLTQVYLAHFK